MIFEDVMIPTAFRVLGTGTATIPTMRVGDPTTIWNFERMYIFWIRKKK
jgi:hypothetical protein